jgi:hypothetical protein
MTKPARPSPREPYRSWRRLRPELSSHTWGKRSPKRCVPFIWDQLPHMILRVTKLARAARLQIVTHFTLSSSPVSTQNKMRARWPAAGRLEEQRHPWACSLVGDVQLRVSAPLPSRFAAVPLVMTCAHNPRVVADKRRCGGPLSLTLTGLDLVNGGPRVSHGAVDLS